MPQHATPPISCYTLAYNANCDGPLVFESVKPSVVVATRQGTVEPPDQRLWRSFASPLVTHGLSVALR